MDSTGIKLQEYQNEALKELSHMGSMNKSEIIRACLSKYLGDFNTDDGLPDWVIQEAEHDRITRENNPSIRAMHFKQNVYEYLREKCLTDDDGNFARFAPEPDKVAENYLESCREQVREEIPEEYEDEYMDHVDRMEEWYRMVHPDTGQNTREGLVECVRYYVRWEGNEVARSWIKSAEERGAIPGVVAPKDILQEAIEAETKDEWKSEWDDAIRP